MKRRLFCISLLAVMLISIGLAWSDDWADKFSSARVRYTLYSDYTFHMDVSHNWDGGWLPRWESIGTQTIAGRTNAVERIQYDVIDRHSGFCLLGTTRLERWRRYPAPTVGSSCSGTAYVGSVEWTVDSCFTTYFVSHRNLPEMDFSAETSAPTNAYTGYVSRVSITDSNSSVAKTGCFSVYWIP